jgi:hypothetical protein
MEPRGRIGGDEPATHCIPIEGSDRRGLPCDGRSGVTTRVELGQPPTDEAPIHVTDGGGAGAPAEVEELGEIAAVGIDGVG